MNRRLSALFGSLVVAAVIAGQLKAQWRQPTERRETRSQTTARTASGGVIGPDVIVSRIDSIERYGTVGDISAYAISTTSCNLGDTPAEWLIFTSPTNHHPLILQNMYRYEDGRFEQIGMSWLKHAFCAVDEYDVTNCGVCQADGSCEALAVGCSDTYQTYHNGDQTDLGPRSEVNAATATYPYPYSLEYGTTGDAIFKRLQVHNNDIDPTLNPGARYFVEALYLTTDEPSWGNQYNNATYRECFVGTPSGSNIPLAFNTSSFRQMKTGIEAWQEVDPDITLSQIDVAGDGRFYVGSRATDNGDGTWHYEYAVYNYNSDRSGGSFTVPVSCGAVSNLGFHDVDYHSGEPYSGADWPGVDGGASVSWATEDYATNADANALRWNTMYSFRFDADTPPQDGVVTLGLFKPGAETEVGASAVVPGGRPPCFADIADGNASVDVNDLLTLLAAWGMSGSPADIGGPSGCPDDVVNVTDLLDLLAAWGPCP